MRVLVASINFHPDHSGIALYSTDCAAFLAERGHTVTMVTGFPYYPSWRKRPGDRGALFRTETWRGMRVLRGYLYVPRRVDTVRRILHELSFAAFALINGLRAGRQDMVVVFSPPLLLGAVGVLLAYLWGARLVVNVQDLQPDGALSLGLMRPSLVIRLLLHLEQFVYRHATTIATISPGMRARLVEKGVEPERLLLWPNWIDIRTAERAPDGGRFRARFPELADRHLVAYAGNVGVKQGLDTLIALAGRLRDDPRVHVFLIGDGADRGRLEACARGEALPNLTFLPMLDPEAYKEMLVDVDVVFVGQRVGAGEFCFPSKLLGILALGKPLLVSADAGSELARVVSEGRCGFVASPDDPATLHRHLLALLTRPALRSRLGVRGRKVAGTFQRDAVLADAIAGMQQECPQLPTLAVETRWGRA